MFPDYSHPALPTRLRLYGNLPECPPGLLLMSTGKPIADRKFLTGQVRAGQPWTSLQLRACHSPGARDRSTIDANDCGTAHAVIMASVHIRRPATSRCRQRGLVDQARWTRGRPRNAPLHSGFWKLGRPISTAFCFRKQ